MSTNQAPARRERGVIIVSLALFLMVLLAFVAFGTEAGRWFLVRAELSKSVDAGALVGARNVSNPNVDAREVAREFCQENFPNGYLGTPGAGAGSPTFDVELGQGGRIDVQGHTTSPPILAQVLGFHAVDVSSHGAAQQRPVEIMMVLDRSGSMAGQPMTDLKVASQSFVDFFEETQNQDKVGLISFATGVTVDRPLGTKFVAPIKTAITGMKATGHTNPEDAFDQANGPQGFTDQKGVPAESRIKQYVVFFSDGRPNSFRGQFMNAGKMYDAVAYCNSNCDGKTTNTTETWLWSPGPEQRLGIRAYPTGDGLIAGLSQCGSARTRWMIFDNDPVPGFSATDCGIPNTTLANHICGLASMMAIQKARELRADGVDVFVIGLGEVNPAFLEALATSPEHVYYAPTSDELQALFQKVAMQIKLRLVM